MIDLYLAGTANGLRAAVALAETGLAHRVHKVDLANGEQRGTEFLKINPSGQIPAMVDQDGPGGRPLALAQSGAIVIYACEKAAKFIPTQGVRRAMASQWFMQALSDIAGTSGGVFQLENVVPERSEANTLHFKQRLIGFFRNVNRQLAGRDFLADEISFADLALYPNFAARKPLLETAGGVDNLMRWGARMAARPGVQKGMSA